MMLKLGHFGNYFGCTWKILKRGAAEWWRISFGLMV